MIITDAKMTKLKNVAVFLDDEFAFSMAPELWQDENLKIGMEITVSEVNRLSSKANYHKAKQKALSLLSSRSYSKKNLKKKLCEKQSEEIAEKAIERMEELGLVNDESYCRDFANYLFSVKKFGKKRIVSELNEKGIDKFIIEDVLEEIDFSQDFERALSIALKKYRTYSEKDKNKIYSFLLRCGYDYSIIKEVLDNMFDAKENDYEL